MREIQSEGASLGGVDVVVVGVDGQFHIVEIEYLSLVEASVGDSHFYFYA